MNVDATELREVVNLHRVQGQVDGLGTMIEDGRDCRDVVRQFAAATRALERAGALPWRTSPHAFATRRRPRPKVDPEELRRLFLQLA